MTICAGACACVCVFGNMLEREREREGGRHAYNLCVRKLYQRLRGNVSVSVCVTVDCFWVYVQVKESKRKLDNFDTVCVCLSVRMCVCLCVSACVVCYPVIWASLSFSL